MSQQGFVFPELIAATQERPARCPRCGRTGMGWHRRYDRMVVDPQVPQVEVIQYQCEGCGASQTLTPPGLRRRCRHSRFAVANGTVGRDELRLRIRNMGRKVEQRV